MTITGGTYGVKYYDVDNGDVINCQIAGNSSDGIYIEGAFNYDLTNNLIHGKRRLGNRLGQQPEPQSSKPHGSRVDQQHHRLQ